MFQKVIDVVKLDVESNEWDILKDILETGVFSKIKQLLVEWHLFQEYPSKNKYIDFYRNYVRLKANGFRTYRKFYFTRYEDPDWSIKVDVNYINTNY